MLYSPRFNLRLRLPAKAGKDAGSERSSPWVPKAVLQHSRSLILDPIARHPESLRKVFDPNFRGTVKELAQLDGAFVISESGVFVAACR